MAQTTPIAEQTSAYASELELAQALIRTESPSEKESAVMALMVAAFESLGFDEAYLDKAGNAVGMFKRGDGPNVMLNGHLDTVPLGDSAKWAQPPLSGKVVDGHLWGRGAVDMKSALACMAFAAKDAVNEGFTGTLAVTAVVQEEIGGLGARYLSEKMSADVVILGEPSNLNLMLGHRGRVELEVQLPGKIAHAAKSELGDNALYHAADFLQRVRDLELPAGGPLGGSTLTPTRLISHPQDGKNVVPGQADLIIDYRNIPGDEPEAVKARLKALMPEATFLMGEVEAVSENGEVKMRFPHYVDPYLAPGENTHVTLARQVIRDTLEFVNVPFKERVWWFATDAPHLAEMGAPVIGFGPGDESLAHTTNECVPVEHLEVSRAIYKALALAYAAQP